MKSWSSHFALWLFTSALSAPIVAQSAPALVESAAANPSTGKFISGGVGDEERARLESLASNYNMHFSFSATNGQFVVADSLSIRSAGNEVLNIRDAGPLVHALLPPGKYVAEGSYKGVHRKAEVVVSGSGANVRWVWPVELD